MTYEALSTLSLQPVGDSCMGYVGWDPAEIKILQTEQQVYTRNQAHIKWDLQQTDPGATVTVNCDTGDKTSSRISNFAPIKGGSTEKRVIFECEFL